MTARVPRVSLVGANGFGLVHRRALAPLQAAGRLELVGLCDPAPVSDAPDAPVPATARIVTDHRDLFATVESDVAIIATPPHTHLAIATAAVVAGADLLLEKPPVRSLAEHATLARELDRTRRVCQVGFQALGSAALSALCDAIGTGALGPVTGVSAVGAWQRPDAYYQRSRWAGRRFLDGEPVLDGALANPFAHAVMQCLAVAAAAAGRPVWPVEVEVERYRARPIEVDDTAVLRVRLDHGPPVVVAVTLCADEHRDPLVWAHTPEGPAELWYTADRLRLPREPVAREVPGRIGLLEDLLAYRGAAGGLAAGPAGGLAAGPAGGPAAPPLVAPLGRTAAFTAVIDAIGAAPVPALIGARHLDSFGEGSARVVTVPGVSEVLRRAAATLALPSELEVGWAKPGWRRATASGLQQPGG